MGTLQEIERLLSHMSRAEKAPVLQWVVRDLGARFPALRVFPASQAVNRASCAREFRYGSSSKPDSLAPAKPIS